jgi:hypothetical protein
MYQARMRKRAMETKETLTAIPTLAPVGSSRYCGWGASGQSVDVEDADGHELAVEDSGEEDAGGKYPLLLLDAAG